MQDIVEMVGNMSRRVRSQTQRDEGAWQEHISVVFKAMVASVWFSGTIQFCRQQVGPALYSDSFGGFPAGLDPTVRERQASDITTMLQSSFNWVDEEPDALPTIVYLVPSIAVELSVAGPCMTSDASTRVPYSEHSEYFGTQKIRLHAPLKRLQEEKRLLKSLRHVGRRVSVPANEERERLGKWHFYPAFGSTSREGPCGFKGMLHADTIVPNRRTIPATGAYGILDVMAPIDITPPAEDGPGGDEPTTRIAPSLSIYETTVRSYNLNGNILKKNDGYKQAMLDLVKSSVDGKSRSDKAQFLRTFGKDLVRDSYVRERRNCSYPSFGLLLALPYPSFHISLMLPLMLPTCRKKRCLPSSEIARMIHRSALKILRSSRLELGEVIPSCCQEEGCWNTSKLGLASCPEYGSTSC